MLGVGLSLASVASAQDDVPAATAAADVADAGDSADAPVAATTAAEELVADAAAAPAEPTVAVVNYALVNSILLIWAVLVVFMQARFAMVELGLNSAKNTVNILAKNLLDLAIGVS